MKEINLPLLEKELADIPARFDKKLRSMGDHRFAGAKRNISNMIILGLFLLGIFSTYVAMPFWAMTIIYVIAMPVLLYLIGTRVMHPYMHGVGFKNQKASKSFGASVLALAVGYGLNWDIQHNRRHHSDTNIHEHDDDIDGHGLLRLCKQSEWKSIHRLQRYKIYVMAIYSTMTIYWATVKDFKQLKEYRSVRQWVRGKKYHHEMKKLIFVKIAYWMLWIILPVIFTVIAGQGIFYSLLTHVLLFVVMHLIAGVLLAMTFQLAHRVEETPTLVASSEKDPRKGMHYLIHQIDTTANFSMKSKMVSWFTGGLNFQREHHLFPQYSERHYPVLAEMVEEVCARVSYPCHAHATIVSACRSHFRELTNLSINK